MGPCMVASSSHSDSELWHNFLGQEAYTVSSLHSGI